MFKFTKTGLLLLAAASLLTACLAKQKKQPKTGPFLQQDIAPLGDDLMALPEGAWSAGQRRNIATFYFLSAEQLAIKGDFKEAFPLYEAAYNLDPNGFLGGKMVAAKAALGDLRTALKEANKMSLLYPRDANIHFLFGKILIAKGDLDEATRQFEETVKYDENHEAAYLALIELKLEMRKYDEAEAIASKMTEKLPWSVNSWVQLTRVYLLTKNKEKALQTSEKAYNLHEDRAELILLRAITLEMNGQSKAALPLFEQLFRMNPTNEELLAGIVDLYRKIGDLREALALIEGMKFSADDPKSAAIIFQKAILLWELENYKESTELLEKLVKFHPDMERFRYMLAWAYEHTEQYEAALREYDALPTTSKFQYFANSRKVVVWRKLNQFDKAVQMAEQLIKEKPDDWKNVILLAATYSDQKNYKKAIEVVEQGFEDNPKVTRLLFLRGVYLELDGQWEECVENMEKVIELDPNDASALNYLGFLYAEKGVNLDEAEKLIRKALEIKPKDGYYLDSLGWVYYQRQQYDEALKYLLEANELTPNEGVILEHIADVYMKQGKKDLAVKFYELAGKGRLEDRDKQRLFKKLKELNIEIPEPQN